MNGKKVVIALGGNAIANSKGAHTAESQQQACLKTAKLLLSIIKTGNEVIVAHGNGPQVGNLILQQQANQSDELPSMPLDTVDAMTQGMIGYWMQRAIDIVLAKEGIHKESATIITQVVVDEDDPAFLNPTKPIGPFYSEEEVIELKKSTGYIYKEDAGRGYRRVVPSPKPKDIIEKNIINDLIRLGYIVVAVGGGGIPVIKKDNGVLEGVEGVIDKDFASEKLAELVGADTLLILTDVDYAYLHYHTEKQQPISKVKTDELKKWIREGHFHKGSMEPKVEAAIRFVESKEGRIAIITSLERAEDALQGKVGTRITT